MAVVLKTGAGVAGHREDHDDGDGHQETSSRQRHAAHGLRLMRDLEDPSRRTAAATPTEALDVAPEESDGLAAATPPVVDASTHG
ncbi:hypothetical protein [Pseudokineococcus sp. 1T1Z-3]|uniref:hypothetical protein n=1 Tax=Pseudokineococcus sp. 1T1Z-3 TaxID=3132745 RepID=UPI0030B11EF6